MSCQLTFVCLVQTLAGEEEQTVDMTNPQPQNSNTQITSATTTRGTAGEGGFQFEIKMAAVIGLRGLKQGHEFELSSNRDDAGNFDDLEYTGDGRRYFLQLKHSYKPDERILQLYEMKKIVRKCFRSYRTIISDLKFKNIAIENTEFMIYTNRTLHPKLTWRKAEQMGDNIFFKTQDRAIFKFNPDENENKELYKFLGNTVKGSGHQELKPLISDFLKKLRIVTGQVGHRQLDKLIAAEICEQDKIQIDSTEYNSILNHFKTPLERWWRNIKREVMTPDMLREWLQRAKTEYYKPVVNSSCNSCTNKLIGRGINFSDSEVSRLHAELSNNRAVHLRSDALTLCSILLLDCLDTSKCIFVTFESLQSNTNMLLHAWLGGHWEWLIVFCDPTVQQSDISDTCNKITEIIKSNHSTKHAIILTASSVHQINDFVPIEHKFKFEHLSQQSQELVLGKNVNFQGCEVTLRSVLQRHGNVEHVLGPELVTDLITEGTAVNIGGRLQGNTGYYAPRFLEREIYLRLEVLQKPNIYGEVFVVNGMTTDELFKIVPSFEILENFTMGEKAEQIVLQTEHGKPYFSDLCEKYKGKTLHWLKYVPKDQTLLWKQSHGATDNLLDYVDLERTHGDRMIIRDFMRSGSCEVKEESIWDLGERTVLVVAKSGMGKSGTTTQVAWHTKLAHPTSWVVRINWNDHTTKLQEINTETFNFDSLVEFLCSAALTESKYTDINRILFKEALQNSGNVRVLMDGFDEINPILVDKAAVILSELMKTKVERVWVTSRPVEKERLEKELCVTAFSLKKLPKESQKEMLCYIWKSKANREKLGEVVCDLLEQVNESVYQSILTGCPLNIMMIASALEEKLESSVETGKICLPDKFDLLYLYDAFAQREIHNDETGKKGENLTNTNVQDGPEMLTNKYLEKLEECSLLVTLPSELNPLRDEEMQTTIQPFVAELQAGKDKICIAMNVVEKKPRFAHRSLAEYFTARWFSKNFESNRSVLDIILFDSSYGIVKDVFDRILARDCPLHCAVLDRDTDAVETLLKGGSDVNDLDKGGRTAMHLIAADGCDRSTCEEITDSLLRHGASVHAKDRVLECTALGYAIKAQKWFVVERLLERKCKTTDLEHIRQRVDDESYMGKIIDDIKDENYSFLIQYLASICANTRWAPLLRDAVARN